MRSHRTIREDLQLCPQINYLLSNSRQKMIHRQLFRLEEILLRSTTSMMKDHSEIRMVAIAINLEEGKIIKIKMNRSSIRVMGKNRHQTITIKMMVRMRGNTMKRINTVMSRDSRRLLYNLIKLMKGLLLLLLEDRKRIEISTIG